MNKTIAARIAELETTIQAAYIGGKYCIKINNSTAEIARIIAPGNIKTTVDEYASPHEVVRAVEGFILKRRLHTHPICRFDNIVDLYPEAATMFEDCEPMQDRLRPYYGRDDVSIYQYELRHILLYRHAAALVYGTDHNAYVVGNHPAQTWFEAVMQPGGDMAEKQVTLLCIIKMFYTGQLQEYIDEMNTEAAAL